MKKLFLMILVLGLMLSSNAYADHLKIKHKDENQIIFQSGMFGEHGHQWPMSEAHCAQYKKFNWHVGKMPEHGKKWSVWVCSVEPITHYKGQAIHWNQRNKYDPNHPWVKSITNESSTDDKIAEKKKEVTWTVYVKQIYIANVNPEMFFMVTKTVKVTSVKDQQAYFKRTAGEAMDRCRRGLYPEYCKIALVKYSEANYPTEEQILKNKKGMSVSDVKIVWNGIQGSTKRAVKPKKKKPKKQTPDDEKIVAAASGSGFFVSNTGHIVTNHHVIDECKAVKVNFKGDEIEAKILAIDKTNDLAILKANINPSKVYSVSNEDVTLLQDIIVAGFPLGKRVSAAIKTHKGSVSALAGFGDNYSNFQTDATINQGNSGGPVMDHKGNIVGVAVALMSAEAGQNIFFAVKSSTLKTFANANGITFLPPNNREMSNAELGQLITEGTLFLECWMTIAKIKQIIAQEENRKAFYSEFK